MFENRSFDSLIGYAYRPGEPPRNQTYNGVAGKTFRSPVPDYIEGLTIARFSPQRNAVAVPDTVGEAQTLPAFARGNTFKRA